MNCNYSYGNRYSEIIILFLLLQLLFSGCGNDADRALLNRPSDDNRKTINIDLRWKFNRGDSEGAEQIDFDDTAWETLNLPHDWAIQEAVSETNPSGAPGGYFPDGIGWYRKQFLIAESDRNKRVYIQFDGINRNSSLWLNGRYVGHKFYGYASHYYDISEYLNFDGPNLIAVKVDSSQQPNDRWYAGSGIYRHVNLVIANKIHIPIWGTSITTSDISSAKAAVNIRAKVNNDSSVTADIRLVTAIVSSENRIVAESETPGTVDGHSWFNFHQTLNVADPQLWATDTPFMYTAVTKLYSGDEVLDTYITPFGIRSIEFNAESGFLLNGQKVILKGVNLHHDGGSVGAAVPEEVWERRLAILKEIGCNAVRLSHNPHAPELLEMCDRMGFLVINEMYDKWRIPANNQTIADEDSFDATWENDLKDFIDRDRNHPSVIIWSVGNEVYEQAEEPKSAVRILQNLVEFVHMQDPSRQVTCGLHPDFGGEVPSRMMGQMDVVSYNYQTANFADWHEEYPSYKFIISETMQYREDFSWPYSLDKIDYSGNSWFRMEEFIAGQFIWSGIDYLGESAGWPEKGLSCGLLYTNGLRKANSYFTESIYSDKPMVHLAVTDDKKLQYYKDNKIIWNAWHGPWVSDHWTFPEKEDESIEVLAFTNCDEVELFQDGISLGSRTLSDSFDQVLRWNLVYTAGELRAVGKIGGEAKASHVLKTAGRPDSIKLIPDAEYVKTEGRDVVHIEVQIIDDRGNLIPEYAGDLSYSIEGPGKIIGIDNGNLSDTSGYWETTKETMDGRSLVIIQAFDPCTIEEMERRSWFASLFPLKIRLKAQADNLTGDEIKITVKN